MTSLDKLICQLASWFGGIAAVILPFTLFPFNSDGVFWTLVSICSAIGVNLLLRKTPEQQSPE